MSGTSEVAKLREARESPSVLKTRLALIRSNFPEIRIIAFEGSDDKIVYSEWIRGIDENFDYEPLVCGGKRSVRSLKNLCARDRTDLGNGVLFIVDHDFDGLEGFEDVQGVYCTTTYSFENHLVCSRVLDLILRDEFPCDGFPELRSTICQTFQNDYLTFLLLTRPVNLRIFVARRLNIELNAKISSSLAALADVQLNNVSSGNRSPNDIVQLSRPLTRAEMRELIRQFRQLDGQQNYRGKFALKFFRKWLEVLAEEYHRNDLGLFDAIDNGPNIQAAEWTLSSFASKCRTPNCFRAFILAH